MQIISPCALYEQVPYQLRAGENMNSDSEKLDTRIPYAAKFPSC